MTDINQTTAEYIQKEAHAQQLSREMSSRMSEVMDAPDFEAAKKSLHDSPAWAAKQKAWAEVEALENALIQWFLTRPAGFYFHGITRLTASRDTCGERLARVKCLTYIARRLQQRGSVI